MLTGNWLEIGKLNQITVTIGGKKVPLRCTVSQVERFQALGERMRETPPVEGVAPGKLLADALDVVEIVLNPMPNETSFARSDIETAMDADQVKILAQVWIDRKMFSPRVEPDPTLGPSEKAR